MRQVVHLAKQSDTTELINLYKKHRAFNRLSADPDVAEKINTSIWFHPYHLDFIERLAEHRGVSINAMMIELLTWGMATNVPPTMSHGLVVGKAEGCVCKRLRIPEKISQHLRWLAHKHDVTMSYIVSVYAASYMVKIQGEKQSA